MRVEVEMKITFLEGEEEGRVIQDKAVMETIPEITEYGVVEHLTMEWKHIH